MSPLIIIGILLGALIGFIALIVEYKKEKRKEHAGPNIIGGAVIGFLIMGFAWFVGGVDYPKSEIEKEHRGLVALKDGNVTEGSFFLGCGNMSSSMNYFGYEDLGDHRFKMVEFAAKYDIVVEDIEEGEQPYFIEIFEIDDPDWEWRNWFWGPGGEETERHERYEIHIPPGSILKDTYELDLE